MTTREIFDEVLGKINTGVVGSSGYFGSSGLIFGGRENDEYIENLETWDGSVWRTTSNLNFRQEYYGSFPNDD